MVRRNRHYPKNSKIWGAPCDALLGIGPRNLYNTGNQRVSIKKKILDALSQKLGEILGGSQNYFVPLISKMGRQIRNIFTKFERTRNCASTVKFVRKSIRRKYVKNANERGHKFSAKNSKVRPPANSKMRTDSAIICK